MINSYSYNMKIAASRCDYSGKLGMAEAVAMFSDIASEHADLLNVGTLELMKRNFFWVCAKTRIEFVKRPSIGDDVIFTTWPEKPERITANRDYEITDPEGNVLVCGKTQWVIVNTETGRPCSTIGVYPEGLEHLEKLSCPTPFARIRDDFSDIAPFAEYTVTSEDIDIGLHMNNAKYVRAFMRLFTMEEWTRMDLKTLEIQYKTPCHEGDRLEFQRRDTEDGATDYRMSLDGKTIALIRTEGGLSNG